MKTEQMFKIKTFNKKYHPAPTFLKDGEGNTIGFVFTIFFILSKWNFSLHGDNKNDFINQFRGANAHNLVGFYLGKS